MPTLTERILALFYAAPTVHEQRMTCFKNLQEIQERIHQAEPSVKDQPQPAVYAEYQREYSRCEPIMRME